MVQLIASEKKCNQKHMLKDPYKASSKIWLKWEWTPGKC